ncbi:MAG: DUF4494 domain-containing protein [Bacteroidaceae bacterium]|nr:DUF4494 domain-containing protein [Bacteroidaceae bacterium]
MAQWFECKIRYDKTMEDGKIKKVTETYMVDALTFTEAEKRFLEEVEPYLSGDYEVAGIKKAKIAELFESVDGNDDRWYKAKVAFITLDEKTAVEKRTSQTMLIQARDLKTAVANLEKGMAGTMGDWDLTSITETPILDIYPYEKKEAETKKA